MPTDECTAGVRRAAFQVLRELQSCELSRLAPLQSLHSKSEGVCMTLLDAFDTLDEVDQLRLTPQLLLDLQHDNEHVRASIVLALGR